MADFGCVYINEHRRHTWESSNLLLLIPVMIGVVLLGEPGGPSRAKYRRLAEFSSGRGASFLLLNLGSAILKLF